MNRSDRRRLISPAVASLVMAAQRLRLQIGAISGDIAPVLGHNKKSLTTATNSGEAEPRSAKEAEALARSEDNISPLFSIDNPPFDSLEISGE